MSVNEAISTILGLGVYTQLVNRGASTNRLLVDAIIVAFANKREDEAVSVLRVELCRNYMNIMASTQKGSA